MVREPSHPAGIVCNALENLQVRLARRHRLAGRINPCASASFGCRGVAAAGLELLWPFAALPPALPVILPPVRLKNRPKNRPVSAPSWNFFANCWFRRLTRVSGDDLVFINSGYEKDPPMALPL